MNATPIHVQIKLEPEPEIANCAQCRAECKAGYVCQECPDRFVALVYTIDVQSSSKFTRIDDLQSHGSRRLMVSSNEGVLACRKYCNGHKDAVLAHCGTCFKGRRSLYQCRFEMTDKSRTESAAREVV
ncbi:hypothetical protein MRB53_041428 [Persea americana]|nr:hypothetical protein MRB53_041428 [Persea americana]